MMLHGFGQVRLTHAKIIQSLQADNHTLVIGEYLICVK